MTTKREQEEEEDEEAGYMLLGRHHQNIYRVKDKSHRVAGRILWMHSQSDTLTVLRATRISFSLVPSPLVPAGAISWPTNARLAYYDDPSWHIKTYSNWHRRSCMRPLYGCVKTLVSPVSWVVVGCDVTHNLIITFSEAAIVEGDERSRNIHGQFKAPTWIATYYLSC